ncbi:hypothetical protein SNE40_017386 [Patella caerulea]|uniref:SID1 transmembrane family member 1 n=1 Tax=Patella caerulea TaxID=87958 RepID=A0AAN8JB14_PATCE
MNFLSSARSFDLMNYLEESKDLNTTVIPGNFSNLYEDIQIDRHHQYLFVFSYNETNETTAVRIHTSSDKVNNSFPIMFVVRQQQGLLSWQVPLSINYNYRYKSVNRTLCPMDKDSRRSLTRDQLIYIDVSTMSVEPSNFTISVSLLDDFLLSLDTVKNTSVSPAAPEYYMFTFPDNVVSVLLTVESEDKQCMVVSIQDIKCPVFDLDNNIVFQGKYQTMTKQAALILNKEDYDEDAFYVVMVVKSNDLDCNPIQNIQPATPVHRNKNVNILIKGTISKASYYKGIFVAVAFFLSFYLVAFFICIFYHCCGYNSEYLNMSEDMKDKLLGFYNGPRECHRSRQPSSSSTDRLLSRPMTSSTRDASYGSIANQSEISEEESASISNERGDNSDQSEVDTSEIDMLRDAYEDKRIVRTKTALFVTDLSRKSPKKLSKTYKIYHWNLLTIGIFYGLPVIQLVVSYQKVLHRTGDQDICYYNFYCAHPLGVLSSFNNVFSNIGYVLLGALFIIIVRKRASVHRAFAAKNKEISQRYGIPQHYGLYYAMGLALMMEGLMSACYHVCPNNSNFQFDTSFMYIIACLNMLKIYQTRHPDINAKAHTTYLSMAFVIFIAVIGVAYANSIFWILYALVHMLVSLILSAQIYFMGMWKVDCGVFKRLWWLFRNDCLKCGRPIYPNRFVLLLIGNIINWSFAIYGFVNPPTDFATYLLAIFIGNLMLYVLFYIIMKLLSGEKIHLLATACIIIATLTWAGALYFFFAHLTSWSVTPATSKEGNRQCLLLEFYDAHDIWHFLSAIGMFFGFLIILTLDDDLMLKRRDQIPVF